MSAPFRYAPLFLLLATAGMASADIIVEDRPLSSAPAIKATPATAPAVIKTVAAEKTVINESAPPSNGPASGGDSNWELYTQVQQLQQEVAGLRGTLEEQSHLIEKLQSDLRARYTDLDQRLNAQQDQLKQAAPVAAAATGTEAAAPSATIEEEKKAYLAAYDTYRAGGPGKAIPPMLAFVKRYPNSTFTPNAYYWLGEFYLNTDTPDQAAALKHFETVGRYPDNAKAPAALYKIGSILDLQSKPLDAKKKMQELLAKYPKSPEAGLADSYLKALEAAQAAAAKPAAAEKPVVKAPGKAGTSPVAKKATAKKG